MATYASIKYDMDLASSATGAGALTLLETLTADNSGTTLTFASNIDSTYKEYIFKFYNMHCAADDGYFQVNFRDGSTAYDATKTTTFFRAQHSEGGTGAEIGYQTADDLAQSTGVQRVSVPTGSGNDECMSGTLHLFDPSSTTYVKHFYSQVSNHDMSDYNVNCFMAGYCNVTAAIDGVQFSYSTGNIQSGVIKMYGVS
jgi:hypothetical protein